MPTMNYYPTSTIMAKILKTDISKGFQGHRSGTGVQQAQTLCLAESTKAHLYPACCWVPIARKWALRPQRTYTRTPTAALSRTAQTWKLPTRPSTVDWISKFWHIPRTEYNTAMRQTNYLDTQNMGKYHILVNKTRRNWKAMCVQVNLREAQEIGKVSPW